MTHDHHPRTPMAPARARLAWVLTGCLLSGGCITPGGPGGSSTAAPAEGPGIGGWLKSLGSAPTVGSPNTGPTAAGHSPSVPLSSAGADGAAQPRRNDTSGLDGRAGDPHTTVSTGPRASADEVRAMLLRSDPAACSATSDASLADTVSTYGKLAVGFGAELADTRVNGSNAQLQSRLDELRPVMRQLSRNTNWMPVQSERLFGEQIVAYNGFEPYTIRNQRLKRLHDQVVLPMFEALRTYAKDTLKSELDFELKLYRHESKTPAMIAGGILLVPSGMLDALSATEHPDEVVAFMLAHEFAHALRRHKTKKLQLTLIDSMMLAGEFRQIFNQQSTAVSRLRGGPAAMFSFSKDSAQSLIAHSCKAGNWFPAMEQGQEFEADVCGALLLNQLSRARQIVYSPVKGYAQYLKAGLATAPAEATTTAARSDSSTTATGSGAGATPCLVVAGHPDPGDRMQNLQAYNDTLERATAANDPKSSGDAFDRLPPPAAGKPEAPNPGRGNAGTVKAPATAASSPAAKPRRPGERRTP